MKNRQSGMSLLEILAAIAVGTVLFIGLTDMIDVSLDDARGQQAAHHQSQVAGAAQKYIAANYASLMTDTSSGAVKAITVPDLQPVFLPSSVIGQNSYRQNFCILVRQDAGKLNALIVSYGGMPIPDRSIATVAMSAGQGAGYINSTDTSTARGPSWSMNTTPYRSGTCAGGVKPLTGGGGDAGHLVSNIFYDGPGQLSTDFLYRDPVPGRPELNRMNVPLQMASAGLVNLGDSCSQTALAIESTTKDVVVCDSGKWRYTSSSWKDPVNTYGALASVPKKDGDVRVALNTGRAFVYDSGTNTWTALAIDQNGDLNVPRDMVVARDMRVTRDMWVDRNLTVDETFTASGDATIGETLTVSGNMKALGEVDIAQRIIARGNIDARKNMDIDGYFRGSGEVRGQWMAATMIVIDGRNHAGAACHRVQTGSGGGVMIFDPHGTVKLDSNGIPLTCTYENVFRYANGTNSP